MKPRIFVFSIGEATTDLCMWALERYGWEPVLYQDKTQLWEKLERFYKEPGEVLYRIDADIVPNRASIELTKLSTKQIWMWQTMGWGWYSQRPIPMSLTKVNRKFADVALKHISEAKDDLRPETYLTRLPEFYNPRRFAIADDLFTGLHGYGQTPEDVVRVHNTKIARHQDGLFDWKMRDKLTVAARRML